MSLRDLNYFTKKNTGKGAALGTIGTLCALLNPIAAVVGVLTVGIGAYLGGKYGKKKDKQYARDTQNLYDLKDKGVITVKANTLERLTETMRICVYGGCNKGKVKIKRDGNNYTFIKEDLTEENMSLNQKLLENYIIRDISDYVKEVKNKEITEEDERILRRIRPRTKKSGPNALQRIKKQLKELLKK